ncbi:MAG TPA: isocitrate lyase/phosphoenolpyruvate mutase family protein [Solirubrobacterales bacterium]|nr:isocitrate lyase/phosphoenolpyruvate mutase family protein [Solirubrobacterales bacterium]
MSGGAALRAALSLGRPLRVAGVHDALSALVAQRCGFDAAWASGLGVAAVNGMPDANVLTMSEVCDATRVISQATPMPVISDCDTGFGEVRNLRRSVAEFERGGAAAVCIEDKLYPKRNSFRPGQELLDPYEFAMKVRVAKETQLDPDFMVFARVESLIAGVGMEDALLRAGLYAEAGADAIVIHSKAETATEVTEFSRHWQERSPQVPLVAIPTTYHRTTIEELTASGIAIVIYANQAIRASVRAMESALRGIVDAGTSSEIEDELVPVGALFELTGEDLIDRLDQRFLADTEDARARQPGE